MFATAHILAAGLLLLGLAATTSGARTKPKGRRRRNKAATQEGGTDYAFDPSSVPMVPWVTTDVQSEPRRWNVTCARKAAAAGDGCYPTTCGRMVVDDFFSAPEVAQLLEIVEMGMAAAGSPTSLQGGPTIMDLNTGMLRDADGLKFLYPEDADDTPPIFTQAQLGLYKVRVANCRRQLLYSCD